MTTSLNHTTLAAGVHYAKKHLLSALEQLQQVEKDIADKSWSDHELALVAGTSLSHAKADIASAMKSASHAAQHLDDVAAAHTPVSKTSG